MGLKQHFRNYIFETKYFQTQPLKEYSFVYVKFMSIMIVQAIRVFSQLQCTFIHFIKLLHTMLS